MSTNEMKMDFTFAYVILAAICLVPAVLESGLFEQSRTYIYANDVNFLTTPAANQNKNTTVPETAATMR